MTAKWQYKQAYEGVLEEVRSLKAENAKLRELVRQMYPGAKAFLQLGMQLGCNDTLSYDWWLQLRELGIEECAYEYS